MGKKRFVKRKMASLLVGLMTVTVIAGTAAYGQSCISKAANGDEAAEKGEFETYLSEQGFPESYKILLRQLHEEHPNWVFQAFHTGLEWEDVITNEMRFRTNLVPDMTRYPSSYKDTTLPGAYDWKNNAWFVLSAPNWVQASREAVSYFMDPRNFFVEENMFQFELETFNAEAQTLEGVEQILNGTFMSHAYVDGAVDEKEEHLLSSGVYAVRNTYICGISPETKVGEFSRLLTAAEGKIRIVDALGVVKKNSAYIGTGDSVQIYTTDSSGKETIEDSYGVVLYGDVNGDGRINSLDRATIKLYVYGETPLSGWYLEAADVNHDDRVNSLDRANIKLYVYNETELNQISQEEYLTYGELFMKIGQDLNVSPYMLASRVRQEQGSGTSELISGTVPGYEGYYNYFNIKASGKTREEIVRNGMEEAVANGWDTRYKAIEGGARTLCEGHIWKGQDTLYLQKFDVEGTAYGYFWHQYMQNLMAPYSEGNNVYKAYVNMGALGNSFVFKLPVYNNMPESCPRPVKDGNPNYKLSSLTVEGYSIPFNDSTYTYTIEVPANVSSLTVRAKAYASTTAIQGTGQIKISSSTQQIVVRTVAQNGDTKDYVIKLKRK